MISVEQLKKLQFFVNTSPKSLEVLSKEMTERLFKKDDVLLKEGQTSQALFFVVEGKVRIEKQLDRAGEKSKTLARLGTHELFGEMSFLENKPLSASVVAETDGTLFVLSKDGLDRLIKNDSALAVDQILTLLSGISTRLRRTTQELVALFDVANLLSQDQPLEKTMKEIVNEIRWVLGESFSIAFYRWNMFNDEYDLLAANMSEGVPPFEQTVPKDSCMLEGLEGGFKQVAVNDKNMTLMGNLFISNINFLEQPEGLFLYYHALGGFDPGSKQMIETLSSFLAPALATARHREEEISRTRLQRSREQYF